MDNRFLFRGKRLDNGKWVYGCLLAHGETQYKGQSMVHINTNFSECIIGDDVSRQYESICVDPVAIGQCTGLAAAKSYRGERPEDRLIFEGDICRFKYCKNQYIGKIVFNDKTCAFEIWNNIVVGAYGEKATNTRLLCHIDNIEIIGTVHENPELLEG